MSNASSSSGDDMKKVKCKDYRLDSDKVAYSVSKDGKPYENWSLEVNTSHDGGEGEEVITIRPCGKPPKNDASSDEGEFSSDEEDNLKIKQQYGDADLSIYQDYGTVFGSKVRLHAYADVPNDGVKYNWRLERRKGKACPNKQFFPSGEWVERYNDQSNELSSELDNVDEDDYPVDEVNRFNCRLRCN